MSTAEKEWEHRESDSNDLASLEREFAARFTPPLESPIQTTTGETEAAEQYRLMEIEDGTRWPNPHDGDFAWRLVHGGEPSRGDVLRAVTAWEAYRALTTHPAGTKAMQRKLAMIRRRAKETSR